MALPSLRLARCDLALSRLWRMALHRRAARMPQAAEGGGAAAPGAAAISSATTICTGAGRQPRACARAVATVAPAVLLPSLRAGPPLPREPRHHPLARSA